MVGIGFVRVTEGLGATTLSTVLPMHRSPDLAVLPRSAGLSAALLEKCSWSWPPFGLASPA
jgi:hypothetical protein